MRVTYSASTQGRQGEWTACTHTLLPPTSQTCLAHPHHHYHHQHHTPPAHPLSTTSHHTHTHPLDSPQLRSPAVSFCPAAASHGQTGAAEHPQPHQHHHQQHLMEHKRHTQTWALYTCNTCNTHNAHTHGVCALKTTHCSNWRAACCVIYLLPLLPSTTNTTTTTTAALLLQSPLSANHTTPRHTTSTRPHHTTASLSLTHSLTSHFLALCWWFKRHKGHIFIQLGH